MSTGSTSTWSGSPSLPNSAELTVSLTESSGQNQPQNQQVDQTTSSNQSTVQQVTSPAEPPSRAESSSRVEVLPQTSQKTNPSVRPYPIGTAFFDNAEVSIHSLMPQEMRSSLSGEDNSRDSEFVDAPEPIADNPVWKGMEETKPRFAPKYAYIVDLSADHLPRQTIKREEPLMPKRFDTTIILAAGLISSLLVLGVFYLVKGKKR
ncbi:hypothetical protein ACQ4LE_007533 [Meloidogyne hapla]